jgi:hypothetical protein
VNEESLSDRLERVARELWAEKQSSFEPEKAPPDDYGAGVVPLYDYELAAGAGVDLDRARAWITERDGRGVVMGVEGEGRTIKAFE